MPSHPPRRRQQDKRPTEGAAVQVATTGGAPKRGHADPKTPRMMMMTTVEVKKEREEEREEEWTGGGGGGREGGPPVSTQNRQRLKRKILGRREAQGLGEIEVELCEKPANYELTPEEEHKRERRKEQNRRAARKCRMKKRLQQNDVSKGFSLLMEVNQARKEEVKQLKGEVMALTKILEDHKQSGHCGLHLLETKHSLLTPATSMTSSVTSLPSWVPGEEPLLKMDDPCTFTVSLNVVDMETYLEDMGSLEPDATFTDMEMFMKLEDLENIPLPDFFSSSTGGGEQSPSPILPPLPPLPPSSSPFNPMDSLKNLKPSSPRPCYHSQSLFCPISPAANQDRLSVSSVASDWSVVSEQSWSQHLNQSLLCPVSPVTNQDPRSVSSVASDWSMVSEQSQGFKVPSQGLWEFAAMSEHEVRGFQGFSLVPDVKVEDGESGDEDDEAVDDDDEDNVFSSC